MQAWIYSPLQRIASDSAWEGGRVEGEKGGREAGGRAGREAGRTERTGVGGK